MQALLLEDAANVENGASLINGTLLYPGDSFSVYSKVAPFTADNGYHLAGSYSNGQTVQTYGGGICQVSTTLYNAVLRAELNVTERSNHSMTVHYVPLSADAAISGTDKDLKFTNNLDPSGIYSGSSWRKQHGWWMCCLSAAASSPRSRSSISTRAMPCARCWNPLCCAACPAT